MTVTKEVVPVNLPVIVEEVDGNFRVTSNFIPNVEATESSVELALEAFKRALNFHFLIFV